jgi:Leucine-rich repeat (LRR) protein
MPLVTLACDFKAAQRDAELLRSIKSLVLINGKAAKDFWKEVDAQHAVFAGWLKETAKLPAEKQVDAVAAKLKELNPGFDGKIVPIIEKDVVTQINFSVDAVTDISPIKALTGLQNFAVHGSQARHGQLADLTPLKGMKLTMVTCCSTKLSDLTPLRGMKLRELSCWNTSVSDLSPLKGMPLTKLYCEDTSVSDLSPLKNMKLEVLSLGFTKVSDLSPLKGMPLTALTCPSTQVSDLAPLKDIQLMALNLSNTPVSDLSPLKDMKLSTLICNNTKVTDLTPIKGMPLQTLYCDFKADRDAAILRSIKTLETINGKTAKAFWKEVDKK